MRVTLSKELACVYAGAALCCQLRYGNDARRRAGFERRKIKVCKDRSVSCAADSHGEYEVKMRRLLKGLVLLLALEVIWTSGGGASAKEKPSSWKEIDDAILRLNDAPVKVWGVFQTGKKRDPLLVQMDKRFVLIKIHERQVFEVNPAKVQHKSNELLLAPSDHPAQPLSTSDWEAGDTEAVFRIRVKLDSEGGLLDIELPHPLDLSGMSPHPAAATRNR